MSFQSSQSPNLIFFSSKICPLCQRLNGDLEKFRRAGQNVEVLQVDASEESKWAPELLHYKIAAVPAFVLLDKQGNAVASTTRPQSYEQMRGVLGAFVTRATQQ